jgi:copper transporter 1
MFAGSCIGVIFLVISLEFLRRVGREYDAYLCRQSTYQRMREPQSSEPESLQDGQGNKSTINVQTNSTNVLRHGHFIRIGLKSPTTLNAISQQATRAVIHMVQFAVAYFIMLLAMYYNGTCRLCRMVPYH